MVFIGDQQIYTGHLIISLTLHITVSSMTSIWCIRESETISDWVMKACSGIYIVCLILINGVVNL